MSYVKPSVRVYQDLANAGGVADVTPDLEVCLIGPANNVLEYTVGSTASQIQTAVTSPVSTTGVIASGSALLTVASTAGMAVGQALLITGAGASGAVLQANILSLAGNVVTLDTAASTDVVSASSVYTAGVVSNTSITNTFNLPGQIPGQVIDTSSIKVWTSGAKVKTYYSGAKGPSGYNFVTVTTSNLMGTIPSGSTTLTITQGNSYVLVVGDTLTIPGAGTTGGTLTATVTSISGNSIGVTPAASTTVSSAVAITKVPVQNLNSNTNTLRAEVGDQVVATYSNTSSVMSTFTTYIKSITTTSGVNGAVTNISFTDLIPADASVAMTTVGTNAVGASTINVGSTTGVSVYNQVLIVGGGVGGLDLLANVTSLTATSISIDTIGGLGSSIAAGSKVLRDGYFAVSVNKSYNDIKVISSSVNTTNAGTLGQISLNVAPQVAYGTLVSGSIYAEYKALRTDLAGQILSINNVTDLEQQLGTITDANPLGLACSLSLANTITRVRAIAVQSNDLIGYTAALSTAEGERVYGLVPLTQDDSIIQAFASHVQQMSTPDVGMWRVALANTVIPTQLFIGQYNSDNVNANSGANTVSVINGNYVLTATNATFTADGVVPTDVLVVTAPSNAAGTYVVQDVIGTQLVISGISASLTYPVTSVSYYVTRQLGRTASANQVEAQAGVYKSNRVWYFQPDEVGVEVNGVTKYLPGYYLAAAHGGMVAGFPVQQGFTNIGVAGITDLLHSNYYFARRDLDNMAGSGVCVYVQDSQGGTPYCRHALTTDPSVLEYREQMAVKVWDFLSYYFRDLLKSFIGVWNITPETLNVLRQVLTAGGELMKGKKLPKLGAPLQDMVIKTLEQDANNKDHVNAVLSIKIPYSMNYVDLHLVI